MSSFRETGGADPSRVDPGQADPRKVDPGQDGSFAYPSDLSAGSRSLLRYDQASAILPCCGRKCNREGLDQGRRPWSRKRLA